ncbi:MAG: WG repeat-containing protein [Bacteroidia bacterium]
MKNVVFSLFFLLSVSVSAQIHLFPVEIKGKSGYMDQMGKMVIPATYDLAEDFKEGLAVVALSNMPCVINEKNERVVDTGIFQFIGNYSEGIFPARDFHHQTFYINSKGEKIISLSDSIYEARSFHNGLACISKQVEDHTFKFNRDIVTLGYRFGFIDKTGKLAISFIYEDADDFENGVTRVKLKNKFGLINTKGETILNAEFGNIGKFYEEKAWFEKNGKYGYLGLNGKIIIEPKFDYAFDFSDGLAGVWDAATKKFGYINEKGEVKIKIEFDRVHPFSEGKAAVLTNGKWGFINKEGKMIIMNNFDNAGMFEEGMCAVLVKRKWGFINDSGRLAVPADFDAVGSFTNGVADVVYHGVKLYVDKNGNVLPKLKD